MLLCGRYRISRREAAELCKDLLDLSVSVGSVANVIQRTSRALAGPHEEIATAIRQAPVAYVDETGWREKSRALYLWIVVTSVLALFRIGRRTKEIAQDLLGKDYQGCAVTDRFGGYSWIPQEQHQACWSHLGRDFEGLTERGGEAKVIGEAFLEVHDDLFTIWHQYKDGRITFAVLQRRMAKVEARAGEVLQAGSLSEDAAARSLCGSLCKISTCLFVFSRVEGVEPTNNIGERGVRPAVQWRKICFGTQSPDGSRFVERILTVVGSCRLQKRPLLTYLQDVIVAADLGREIPSLLPGGVSSNPRSHGPPIEALAKNIKRVG